jgi:hypothetical protein
MLISARDKSVLQEVAREVAEICANPIQRQTAQLWTAHNRLERQRPLITLYDWTELETGDPFTLRCEGSFAREIEQVLRRRVYRWEHQRDDTFGACSYGQTLPDEAEPDLIGPVTLAHDAAESARRFDAMCDVFDGTLIVKQRGLWGMWCEPMDNFIQWRGIEQSLLDLIERPAWVHRWLAAITDFDIKRIEQAEAMGLLSLNNHDNFLITGGLLTTDDLPADDFDGEHVRAKDLWGFSSTQIFSEVSPAMHEEFALQYESRFLSRFGLAYYGCCEPLHHKIDLIFKHIPNVRKISMSPWADVEAGAAAIGDKAVFSYKPNPAILGLGTWDVDLAGKQLREVFELTRGCVIEVCMKDLHSVASQPHRMTEWIAMAKALAEDYA